MQYSVIRTIGVILLLPIFNPVIKAETPITIHGMDTFTEYSTGKAQIAASGYARKPDRYIRPVLVIIIVLVNL